MLFIITPYYFSDNCRLCSDVLCLITHISNLYLLSIFLYQCWQKFVNFTDLFKESAICFSDFILSIFFQFHWSLLLFLLFSSFYLASFILQVSFSRFLQWQLKLFIWDFPSFLMYAFGSINFLLSTAVSHKFWYNVFYFSFNLMYLYFHWDFFLTHRLFRNELFSFQAVF